MSDEEHENDPRASGMGALRALGLLPPTPGEIAERQRKRLDARKAAGGFAHSVLPMLAEAVKLLREIDELHEGSEAFRSAHVTHRIAKMLHHAALLRNDLEALER